jgi:RHS repeat-associated protein
VQGTTTNFVYDGLNPVQEKNGATVTANLLTGLGIDEFFTRTDGVGSRALLPDALGSTVALGDNTGTLQTQYTYEPFGHSTISGAASTSSYKYTGREDDDSGLSYYRGRYYHPRLQRFISEDPIGFDGGSFSLYAYVFNNPIGRIDPYGLYDQQSPAQRQTPNSTQSFPKSNGGRTDRFYGPDGKATHDIDYGHDHRGVGDPHTHDWDWSNPDPRGEPRSTRPGDFRGQCPEADPKIQQPLPWWYYFRGLQPFIIFPWQVPFINQPSGTGAPNG